jgi:plasmid stabilization system protein ParE
MPKNVVWSPSAKKDFSKVLAYLSENWNIKIANEFIELTFNFVQQISINPKLFQIISKNEKIRKCVLNKQNTLFYREHNSHINILRIFDTRQNPRKLKLNK